MNTKDHEKIYQVLKRKGYEFLVEPTVYEKKGDSEYIKAGLYKEMSFSMITMDFSSTLLNITDSIYIFESVLIFWEKILMSGQFITIEGIECVGKSTNAKFIESTLNKKGYKTLVTREPGGSGVGEKIRNILLFEKKDTLSPMTELLLLFAAREKHINEIIKPN